MARWRCYRCNPPRGVDFDGSGECPHCRACPPAVVPLVLVHWLLPTQGGRLATKTGGYRVACQPGRTHLIGATATERVEAVTCPACRKAGGDYERKLAEFRELQTRLPHVV